MTHTNVLDATFRGEMAARNPRNAFSCLRTRSASDPILTETEWFAGLGMPTLDRDAVSAAFRSQVGTAWTDLADLPPARRTALTILAADLAGRDVSEALSDLSRAALAGLPDAGMAEIAERHGLRGAAEGILSSVADSHAFSGTVLWETALRLKSRQTPFSSSEYLWLRDRDRTAFLSLVSAGRGMPFVEVAGVWFHHRCETRTGRALAEIWNRPLVDGLAIAIGSTAS